MRKIEEDLIRAVISKPRPAPPPPAPTQQQPQSPPGAFYHPYGYPPIPMMPTPAPTPPAGPPPGGPGPNPPGTPPPESPESVLIRYLQARRGLDLVDVLFIVVLIIMAAGLFYGLSG